MKFTAALLLLLLPAIAFCQDPMAQNYKIYNTAKQRLATADEIIADLDKADVLFFGEEHNDSTGHYLESLLFKKIADKYPGKAGLSMEMFQTDCQTVLNEYLADQIREKNLITEGRAWQNYKDYRPMIETAKAGHIPVVAANAPTRYTNMVTRGGLSSLDKLSPAAKGWLAPLPIDTATGPYYEKFVTIMGGHSAMGNLKIYQSQNVWDATMGWNIAQFLKAHNGYKVFQVNGGFHSEEKLGTAAQLKKYLPKVKILNIQAYADDSFDNPDWNKFTKLGDYVILTNPKLAKTF
ncbi:MULTISPECIES: ChaN family lipoprotein [unclassified Mucilaginibacter]|uniref:ChaN family lipoprotein n=1 Tax=unclassified Mucilaginibacter TaxID=2617802 RepID=UPI002AC94014|nr:MULTISPECIES: ChaN family lipoprotein [unclassified Mucilaginibacter]MEB0260235.1 ChaN family lipoprotein [Mucilaginibacter sp. 10I4]MEB0277354.1 ChaN family lipoprotein [Mucilaginibacter sp. 10B2]MEB0300164.1 ChaN family lipoprotein [Mucilaginibacter sp. 5C4]WPX25478.1 ChaN family lipoprotein [Mucilaginibacter sp. 5C4]